MFHELFERYLPFYSGPNRFQSQTHDKQMLNCQYKHRQVVATASHWIKPFREYRCQTNAIMAAMVERKQLAYDKSCNPAVESNCSFVFRAHD